MRHKAMLTTMVLVLVAGLAILIHSGLQTPSGAATGEATGCGGDPTAPMNTAEADYVLGSAEGDPDAPVKITYQGATTEKSCPTLSVEPGDQIATYEDPCSAPGAIRVWDLTPGEAGSLIAAYQAIRDRTCTSQDCLTVLTQADESLNLELEAPMESQITNLLKKAQSVPATGTGEEAVEPDPPEEADPGAPAFQQPISQVQFKAEQGVDFGADAVIAEGHPLKVDLICYAGSQGLDCQAGAGPTISKQKHLKLFRTVGGTIETFGGVEELPTDLPTDADRDMINGAEAGWGFVLENNLSDTYTRGFIKKATQDSITIQYIVFAAD
jgi:hypothetical protein